MYVHDSLKCAFTSVLTINFDYLHEIYNHNTCTYVKFLEHLFMEFILSKANLQSAIYKQIVHLITCTYDLEEYVK